MQRLLLTGFEPFDGWSRNPASEVMRLLDGVTIAGVEILGRPLPVSFTRMPAALFAAIEAARPDAIIGLGLAGGENAIRLEQVAINVVNSDRPDNDGVTIRNTAADPAGPAARMATAPLDRIADTLIGEGIPARVSFHAGTHCCNLMLYHSLAAIEALGRPLPCCFIHLPCSTEMIAEALAAARHGGKQPGSYAFMEVERMASAVRRVAEIMVTEVA